MFQSTRLIVLSELHANAKLLDGTNYSAAWKNTPEPSCSEHVERWLRSDTLRDARIIV